ncbi:MAG: flagellar motor switch protein FliN [candidate division Zixibacteria bacterium]|nr:flagellar motor switch protein FliN [candidate division Zixibacteria bacterium]
MSDEEKAESQEELEASENVEEQDQSAEDSPPPEVGSEEPVADLDKPEPVPDPLGEAEEAAADDAKIVNEDDASEDDAEAAMMAMLEDLPSENEGAAPEDIDFGAADVSKAEFQHLSEPAAKPEPRNIDLLMDVNLPVSIELGHTKMSISDILSLGPGSIVELNKLAGEPVDVLVNYKIVAKGEVVVIDENFGVRITQLMTPEERLKLLSDEQ